MPNRELNSVGHLDFATDVRSGKKFAGNVRWYATRMPDGNQEFSPSRRQSASIGSCYSTAGTRVVLNINEKRRSYENATAIADISITNFRKSGFMAEAIGRFVEDGN